MPPKKVKSAVIAKDQDWWFVREEMRSDKYVQECVSYQELLKMNITLEHCLDLTKANNAAEFSFFIHSASMAAAVQLLSDESIITTYNLYCTEDPVVTIIMRGIDELSPNASHAPSHNSSLAQRRKVSGRRGLLSPELFIQPTARKVSHDIDVYTMEPVAAEEAVTLCLGHDDFVTLSHEYLLGWIEARLSDSTPLTKISVESQSPDGIVREFILSAEIWQKSLLRGPWKKTFAPVWDKQSKLHSAKNEALAEIAEVTPGFWQACQNFVRDLRSFGSDHGARKRIESTGHQFYLGKPYFDEATVGKLLSVPASHGTLLDALKKLENKRAGSTICASHDLAPLYEGELGVSWNKSEAKAIAQPASSGFLSLRMAQKNAVEVMKSMKNTVRGK